MVKEIDFPLPPLPFFTYQNGRILMGPDAIWVIRQKRAAWLVSGEFGAGAHVAVCLGQCFTYHGLGGPTFLR